MIPFGGHIKKQMPGLRPLSFFIAVALGLFHEPVWGGTSKNKCRGFAPHHFSLLSLWKVNFPRSINEKCPIKGHLFFVRRERDSNPRTCDSQRFSRPPHSTALPSLRRKSKTSKPNYKEIIKKTSRNSSVQFNNFAHT